MVFLIRSLISKEVRTAAAAHSYVTSGTLDSLEDIVEHVLQGLIKPTVSEFARLLKACGDERSLLLGKSVHLAISKAGLNQDTFLCNNIINMYGKCSAVCEGRATFELMQERNVYSWTVMITAYAQFGDSVLAVEIFQKMQLEGVRPNDVTFVAVLGALNKPSFISKGKQVHSCVREAGSESDVVLKNAIVCMYGKCGSLEDAREVFDSNIEISPPSWNGLLSVYIQHGQLGEALQLYKQMQLEGIRSVLVTFVTILSACDCPKSLAEGRLIHSHAAEAALDQNIIAGNAILSMYIKCGSLRDAAKKFQGMAERNVVTWSAMIGAYAGTEADDQKQQQQHESAGLKLLSQMQQAGVRPNDITFTSILSLCNALSLGRRLHSWITESSFSSSVVIGSGLINMYSNCGSLADSFDVFKKMQLKNTVAWTSMIAACGFHGEASHGLILFHQMQLQGTKPDKVTFVTLLDVCSTLQNSTWGRLLHTLILEAGERTDGSLGSALLNMYGKCGSTESAGRIFDTLPRGLSTWNAMVSAYAQGGRASEALDAYVAMVQLGIEPDAVTFVSVLAACSYVGSVEKSHGYFMIMVGDHSLVAAAEHYGCFVDVLCRAGRLGLAEEVMEEVAELKLSEISWLAFLSGCKVHKDVVKAENAARKIVELDMKTSSVYALLVGVN